MELNSEQKKAIALAAARRRRAEAEAVNPDERGGFMNTGVSGTELALGGLEAISTIGAGSVGQIVGGLSGLMVSGKGLDAAADVTESVTEKVSNALDISTYFRPKSQTARTLLGMAAAPLEPLMEGAQKAGDVTMDVTGSPEAATAVKSAIELSPAALGIKKPVRTFSERRADISGIEKAAQNVNLDLKGNIQQQRADIVAKSAELAGSKITPRAEIISKAQSLESVQESVKVAAQAAREARDALYETARKTPAGVPVEQLKIFKQSALKAVSTYDIKGSLKARLKELDLIDNLPDGSFVKLEAMENWRRRINANFPGKNKPAERAALKALKDSYDEFRDDMFNTDMIRGDKEAITNWKKAIKSAEEYKRTFKDDKVIRQLGEKDAPPPEMRKWIFGSAEAGFKAESSAVVKRLKGILGEDSKEMTALRQDALLNILDPLLSREPNFTQFVKNYENLVRNNSSIIKELFPESEVPLRELRDFASAILKEDPNVIKIDFDRLISRGAFGHEIAQKAMKVSVAGQIIGVLRRTAGIDLKTRVISDILGYDIHAPLIPKTPAVIGGGSQTLIDQGLGE